MGVFPVHFVAGVDGQESTDQELRRLPRPVFDALAALGDGERPGLNEGEAADHETTATGRGGTEPVNLIGISIPSPP